MKTQKTEKFDLYQEVTNQIIEAIENGTGEYKMPWHSRFGTGTGMPINVDSHKAYRGVNILQLWASASKKGYRSNIWGTYNQWQEKGCQVRKGEKSTLVVFWKFPKEEESDSEDKKSYHVFARGYCVFNAEQVEGYVSGPVEAPKETPAEQRNPLADAFVSATGAVINHGGNRAFYSPSSDEITMPEFSAFPNPDNYYSVVAHELTHWSGASTRLNRDLSGRFGNEKYAAEELIAELGAAFVCADLGLALNPREDHAPYVASWLKVLKGDKKFIFTAASKAQQAVDYLSKQEAAKAA